MASSGDVTVTGRIRKEKAIGGVNGHDTVA